MSAPGYLRSRSTRLARWPTVPFLAAVGAGAVGAVGIGRPSWWYDEVATVSAINRPLPDLWAMLQNVDAVHGLYYLVLSLWRRVFGISEISLRAFSVLGIAVAAYLVAALALRLGGRRLAITTAIIFAILPRVTWASTEARSYAWVIAIGAATMLLLHRWLAGPTGPSRSGLGRTGLGRTGLGRTGPGRTGPGRANRGLIGYAAVVALGAATFLYSVAVPIALLVTVRRVAPTRLRAVSLATGAGIFAAMPVLALAHSERNQVWWIPDLGWNSVRILALDLYGERSTLFIVALAAVLAAALGTIAARARARRPEAGHGAADPIWWWTLPPVLIPTILLVAYSLHDSMFVSRYLSATVAPFVLFVAAVLTRIPPRGAGVALVVLALSAVPGYLEQREPGAKPGHTDYSLASNYVAKNANRGDCVVFQTRRGWSPVSLRLAYLASPDDFAGLDVIPARFTPARSDSLWGLSRPDTTWTEFAAGCEVIWVIADGERDRTHQTLENDGLHWRFKRFHFTASAMHGHLAAAGFHVDRQEQLLITQVIRMTRD